LLVNFAATSIPPYFSIEVRRHTSPLSVSVPSEDIDFLDAYAAEHDLGSRSAALHVAIRALRVSALPGSYAAAWSDWEGDGEADAWDATAGDGAA
jgi:hypothetical protein